MVKISKGGATVAKTIKGGEGGSSISKQVGWINKNAWLNGSITYTEVIEPLSMIDEAHALNLLEELTFKAPTIKDPTKWLISAAKRASEGDAKPFFKGGKSGGKGTGSKVGKTIGWMNRHGELQQPIRFDEVGPLLMVLGDGLAGKLLKELDDAKETIKNPTAWLASAARRAGTGGMGGMMMDPSAMMMGGGMGMPGSSKKLSKTIGWLNKNSAKENPIMFNEVIGPLMAMGEGAACKLLNEFDEKAGEIKDPTKWLTAAAMRKTRW
mmetsp:Transcript_94483/g.177864  ORF Transcript_94483/g.177864 Transcript_94483/m.177864 type:complete len:267 (+) Transcript_94483:110-910(+)